MKKYIYLCECTNGKRFVTFGNFKQAYNRPVRQFRLISNDEDIPRYYIKSPYGYRCNTSGDRLPKTFRILHQTELN